jgi:polysaccharide export outer membrane protein
MKSRYFRVFQPQLAAWHRSPNGRFALSMSAALVAVSWLAAWETRDRVAPPGVATPAGLRHADSSSARVASITPEERHVFCKDNVVVPQDTPPFNTKDILLCQALGPAAPCDVHGVDCASGCCSRRGWEAMRAIDWQAYAQGEYVGHARLAHVPEYRLRVDDRLDMTYRLTRDETPTPYRLNVGDEIQVESFTDANINRNLLIQPDGTITLALLGQVHSAGLTVTQLRDSLDKLYKKYYKIPAITVTPLKVNTKLDDLRAVIDRRAGIGGQSQFVRVTPEGTISLPAIGTVPAQGLTLPELQAELNERYREVVEGIQIIPILSERAPRYVFVLGEVNNPGRFELTGPTTAIQALSMAGSWRVGANLRQIVVFRRGDDWRLLATMINLEAALFGNQPCPPGEIWIDDSDIVIVPKGKILIADDFIDLVFTRGIYGVFPLTSQISFTKLNSL